MLPIIRDALGCIIAANDYLAYWDLETNCFQLVKVVNLDSYGYFEFKLLSPVEYVEYGMYTIKDTDSIFVSAAFCETSCIHVTPTVTELVKFGN